MNTPGLSIDSAYQYLGGANVTTIIDGIFKGWPVNQELGCIGLFPAMWASEMAGMEEEKHQRRRDHEDRFAKYSGGLGLERAWRCFAKPGISITALQPASYPPRLRAGGIGRAAGFFFCLALSCLCFGRDDVVSLRTCKRHRPNYLLPILCFNGQAAEALENIPSPEGERRKKQTARTKDFGDAAPSPWVHVPVRGPVHTSAAQQPSSALFLLSPQIASIDTPLTSRGSTRLAACSDSLSQVALAPSAAHLTGRNIQSAVFITQSRRAVS
ncbi:hypothetical protein J3F84DRAFT_171644 [Trichoderma pleuroticola]